MKHMNKKQPMLQSYDKGKASLRNGAGERVQASEAEVKRMIEEADEIAEVAAAFDY